MPQELFVQKKLSNLFLVVSHLSVAEMLDKNQLDLPGEKSRLLLKKKRIIIEIS